MYCPKCEAEVESTIRDVLETYPVKGEKITVNARVRFCKCCGTDVWDEELDEKNLLDAFEKYRKKHNLLQPHEIRMIREKYGLSQTAFARILGFGDKTITRYENGSIADAAQNNLIELVQSPKNFKLLLEKNKEKISAQDYENASAAIEALRCKIMYNAKRVRPVYSIAEDATIMFSTEAYFGDVVYG